MIFGSQYKWKKIFESNVSSFLEKLALYAIPFYAILFKVKYKVQYVMDEERLCLNDFIFKKFYFAMDRGLIDHTVKLFSN